jgi:hypothetical protein
VETLNLDDFDNTGQLIAAVRDIVSKKLDMVKSIGEYDEDFKLVVPELEALLIFLPLWKTLIESAAYSFHAGQISLPEYISGGTQILEPLLHILEGHNDRQRRLAGKTDS